MRLKELRMLRQDNLNLPFCVLCHEFLIEPIDIIFWWLFLVFDNWVTVPLLLYYEPSAKTLVFSWLDIKQYHPKSFCLWFSVCIS